MEQAILMANGIVPRPLNPSYNSNNVNANLHSRAGDNDERAVAEIRRLEVELYSFVAVFLPTDLVKVEIEFTPFSSWAGWRKGSSSKEDQGRVRQYPFPCARGYRFDVTVNNFEFFGDVFCPLCIIFWQCTTYYCSINMSSIIWLPERQEQAPVSIS